MDDAQVGALYREQKNLQESIQGLQSQLATWGRKFESLGKEMQGSPDTVVFANAPEPLGNVPISLFHKPGPYDWREHPELKQVGQAIQDLRRCKERLKEVTRLLG